MVGIITPINTLDALNTTLGQKNFWHRTFPDWNSFPAAAIYSKTVAAFKGQLAMEMILNHHKFQLMANLDWIKASFYISEIILNFLTTRVCKMKIFMKLSYKYMAIFVNFPPTSSHLHPLQVENWMKMIMVNSNLEGLNSNSKHPLYRK